MRDAAERRLVIVGQTGSGEGRGGCPRSVASGNECRCRSWLGAEMTGDPPGCRTHISEALTMAALLKSAAVRSSRSMR